MQIHERKSNRCHGFHYSTPGYYFITICTKGRIHYFGNVGYSHGNTLQMNLNNIGIIAHNCFQNISGHFSEITVDEFVVMPNHVHGVLIVRSNIENDIGNAYMRSLQTKLQTERPKMIIPKVIQNYKAAVSRKIRQRYYNHPFAWQKSYYDHVIRSERSLYAIRNYIRWNPLKWTIDQENK